MENNVEPKQNIVFFDIDGTLLKGQSQIAFLRFLLKEKQVSIFFYFFLIGGYALYKIGLIRSPRSIMELGVKYAVGKSVLEVDTLINRFLTIHKKDFIYEQALREIKDHQERGNRVVLLSSTLYPIAYSLGKFIGVKDVLATEVTTSNGVYVGKIDGDILYGENKVASAQDYLNTLKAQWENTWAYGDHSSDIPLLEKVKYPIAVNPDSGLENIASHNHWKILNFK